MYLSTVSLRPTRETAKILLGLQGGGVYASHQLIWRFFKKEKKRSFLYREEILANGMPSYFVLSSCAPDSNDRQFIIQSKPFVPILEKGQRLAFSLRANPTICTSESGKRHRHDVMMHAKKHFSAEKDGSDISSCMEQAAQAWMADEKRQNRWGLKLDKLPGIEAYDQHEGRKINGHRIRFSTVDFCGTFRLADPNKFLREYVSGFGAAKSMGCGLMLIRRA